MDPQETIAALESLWAPESGFLWQARQGRFDEREFQVALQVLAKIPSDMEALPRRIVSLLWYMPLVMEWQTERVRECGADIVAYGRATSHLRSEVERVLGVP